ncbi:MAG: branched-chain amino acid ABC transporter permease [Burkholderiales bacterium]
MRYQPLNLGRWMLWGATVVFLALLPQWFTQSFALTLMSQMCTFIIFALSYNMLLGQSGMLSFGHAVYSGLGAYFAIHALNLIARGQIALPVSLLPLVGGFAGVLFGLLFGYVTTRRAGTTFAMISLGLGEMVFSCSLMFPGFFGGEAGITSNRVVGRPVLGITYGPQVQVYYLIAAWTFVCMAAMFALTRTPLGRIANAVRDNPERAEFIGYDTQTVRFLTLVLASFFAGVSGGLSAINFEIVTAENVGAVRSGGVLLATFIGGTGFFFGPIIGGVIFVFFVVALSSYTGAWLLYLGLFFVIMVMVAPGGLASILAMNLRMARFGQLRRLLPGYGAALGAGLPALLGFVGLVEMIYRLSGDEGTGAEMKLHGIAVDVHALTPWLACAALLLSGGFFCRLAWRRVRREWDDGERIITEKIAA